MPPGAINCSASDESSLQSLRYVRFHLTLRDISLPVEALVLPALAPNSTLLDITIMDAFGGVLDWRPEYLSSKPFQVTMKAHHGRVDLTAHLEKTATAQSSSPPALSPFLVEVHESLLRSFHCSHGSSHESFRGSLTSTGGFRGSFHGRYFHGSFLESFCRSFFHGNFHGSFRGSNFPSRKLSRKLSLLPRHLPLFPWNLL